MRVAHHYIRAIALVDLRHFFQHLHFPANHQSAPSLFDVQLSTSMRCDYTPLPDMQDNELPNEQGAV